MKSWGFQKLNLFPLFCFYQWSHKSLHQLTLSSPDIKMSYLVSLRKEKKEWVVFPSLIFGLVSPSCPSLEQTEHRLI